MQIEGIWISSHNTPSTSPSHPRTPTESLSSSPTPKSFILRPRNLALPVTPASATPSPTALPPYTRSPMQPETDVVAANKYRYESHSPGGIFPMAMTSTTPASPKKSNRRSGAFNGNEKRVSFHTRVWPTSPLLNPRGNKSGFSDQEELDPDSPGKELHPRTPTEQRRASRITSKRQTGTYQAANNEANNDITETLRRRSSEEFRRKMSQIFNERIHMATPAEQLQFDPELRNAQKRKIRSSLIEHFRP